jgi:hypothetical protein
MTAFGTCAGTVRHSACVQFIARARVCVRRTRVRLRWPLGRSPICAAGATWTLRTTRAQWAVRVGHTTVIDAAGAIYVIGGRDGTTYYKDVWVSADGGEHRTRGEELL